MRCLAPPPPARCFRRSWLAVAAAVSLAVGLSATAASADDPSPAPMPAPTASPAETPPAEKPAATPRTSTEAVKKELTAVIDAQLAAFRADDYTKAYGFAASEIKGMFEADIFEKMVRSAYPVIAHSTTADYGMAFDTGEEAVVNVRVGNAEKKSVEYQYLLKKEDGHWKIGGVVEVKAQGLSV